MCEYRTIAKNNTDEPAVLSVCLTMWGASTRKQGSIFQFFSAIRRTSNKIYMDNCMFCRKFRLGPNWKRKTAISISTSYPSLVGFIQWYYIAWKIRKNSVNILWYKVKNECCLNDLQYCRNKTWKRCSFSINMTNANAILKMVINQGSKQLN